LLVVASTIYNTSRQQQVYCTKGNILSCNGLIEKSVYLT